MLRATRLPMLRMMKIDHAICAGRPPNTVSLSRELEVSRRGVGRESQWCDFEKAPATGLATGLDGEW
jgi:hypothetical protein